MKTNEPLKKEGDISHLYTMIKSTESTANTALENLNKFSNCLLDYQEETDADSRETFGDGVIHQSINVILNIRDNLQRMNNILFRLLDEVPSEDINKKFSKSVPEY